MLSFHPTCIVQILLWPLVEWSLYGRKHLVRIVGLVPKYVPIDGTQGGTHPRCRWMKGSSCKMFLTLGPARTHSSFNFQYPPLKICFKLSIDANLLAISRLGARWLLKTEHKRKIALKHSKTSVEYRIAGPKRRMSSMRFGRIWSFILSMIFAGSMRANASRTLPIRISRSLYRTNVRSDLTYLKIQKHTK